MRTFNAALGAGVISMLVISCGADGASTDNGDDAANTEVGPVSFQLPDGFDEVFRDDAAASGWVAEYSDDEEAPDIFIGVWRFQDIPSQAVDGAGELMVHVQMAETHPGLETSLGGEVDISGAEDAYITNLSSDEEPGDIAGRWWALVDPGENVAAAVEFYGAGVSDEDLESFAESLEFDAAQGWPASTEQ